MRTGATYHSFVVVNVDDLQERHLLQKINVNTTATAKNPRQY